jgi:NAD-dependent deacetylase
MKVEDPVRHVAQLLQACRRVTVVTGAGVSAASGVPTFRGREGLWKSYSPQELATPEAFQRNPKLVWEWYNWRRELISKCAPNPAHHVLSRWSRRYPGFTLITQNVDGLHETAATEHVVRFHGSIWEVFCWQECGASPARWVDRTVPFAQIPPPCPYCGGIIRPGVVWFGEGIDPDVLRESADASDCDLFMTIGTSSLVYPAAGLVEQAHETGAFTVEINPESTPASAAVDLSIRRPAESVLQEIDHLL